MLKTFRIFSLIEGLSLLVLLLIAMPAKYQFGYDFIFPVGMAHGVLWIIYLVLSLATSHQQRWSVMTWLMTLGASVIPFAFIFIDQRLKRKLAHR